MGQGNRQTSKRLADGMPSVGRPRDPMMDRKICEAAVELYAKEGWGRFTFEAVARLAGVGKPALYLRYPSKEELLISSIETLNRVDDEIDTGSLHSDLLQYVREAFEFRLSALGTAFLRMMADQLYHPELREPFHERVVRKKILSVRRIIERAKERGELPGSMDTNILLESLDGAVMNRVNGTRLVSRKRLRAMADEYAETLVRMLLEGASAGALLPSGPTTIREP